MANVVTAARILLALALFPIVLRGGAEGSTLALLVFLLAGLTDVVDGRIARALNQVSALGAMLDLIADRLLTLAALAGALASGALTGPGVFAAAILIARDLVVASFGEAAPGLAIRVTWLERIKITFQFAGIALVIAPQLLLSYTAAGQHAVGAAALDVAAVLALVTLADYARRAARALTAPQNTR